jgi:hypothetical protein
VYVDKSGDTELDHDVEVVGWGEEADGLKYWLVSVQYLQVENLGEICKDSNRVPPTCWDCMQA